MLRRVSQLAPALLGRNRRQFKDSLDACASEPWSRSEVSCRAKTDDHLACRHAISSNMTDGCGGPDKLLFNNGLAPMMGSLQLNGRRSD